MNVWKLRKFSSASAFVYMKIYVILALLVHALLTSAETLTYNSDTTDPDIRQWKENYILRLKRPTQKIYPSNYEFDKTANMIPKKRAALLLDRIMVALQKAVDDNPDMQMKGYYSDLGVSNKSGLQRRDQEKGKTYWRCYFNAVTCF